MFHDKPDFSEYICLNNVKRVHQFATEEISVRLFNRNNALYQDWLCRSTECPVKSLSYTSSNRTRMKSFKFHGHIIIKIFALRVWYRLTFTWVRYEFVGDSIRRIQIVACTIIITPCNFVSSKERKKSFSLQNRRQHFDSPFRELNGFIECFSCFVQN